MTIAMERPETGSEWLQPEQLELVSTLVRAGSRFVVVGGRAVQFHGYPRPTKDLDILVELSEKNWDKLKLALNRLGYSFDRPFETLSQEQRYQANLDYHSTQLLTAVNGASFSEIWAESIGTVTDSCEFRVASKRHLILSKQNTTRPVDLTDVDALSEAGAPL